MNRSLIVALFFAPLAIAACASSEAAPSATTKAQPASSTGDLQALCVESMTRNRTCTDDYIPDLVDTRAKLDKPAGIAEKVKTDRDGIIAQAKAEWAEDSKDENIARNCQMIVEHMDPSQQDLADGVKACIAKPDCSAYVACMSPVQEAMLSAAPH